MMILLFITDPIYEMITTLSSFYFIKKNHSSPILHGLGRDSQWQVFTSTLVVLVWEPVFSSCFYSGSYRYIRLFISWSISYSRYVTMILLCFFPVDDPTIIFSFNGFIRRFYLKILFEDSIQRLLSKIPFEDLIRFKFNSFPLSWHRFGRLGRARLLALQYSTYCSNPSIYSHHYI